MKRFKIVKYLFLIFTIMAWGCAAGKREKPVEGKNLQKIYVEEITPETVKIVGKTVQIKIRGHLPSPAYEFERFDIQVKDHVIEITPLAKYDPTKIVAQMLVPFEQVCTLKNLKPDTYEVKISGRTQTVKLLKKIQIR
ncbi:MAG: hypothetical protein D6813_07990 [Calditrichaeota bacterium]|nr:MAG: hypothetical protein D6813_07990 [Calditrichota bacterium]